MTRLLILALIIVPLLGFGPGEIIVYDEQESNGGSLISGMSDDLPLIENSTGYFVLRTSNEQGAASLICYIYSRAIQMIGVGFSVGVKIRTCTLPAITDEGITVTLIGSGASAGEGIDNVCDFPMSAVNRINCVEQGGTSATAFDLDGMLMLVVDH